MDVQLKTNKHSVSVKHILKYLTGSKGKVSSFQKVKGKHFNNVSKKEKITIKVSDMCNYKVL